MNITTGITTSALTTSELLSGSDESNTSTLRSCSRCEVTSSSQWFKNPDDKTLDICQACYRKARKELGKSCSKCLSDSSFHWYKKPDDKTLDICAACYRKARVEILMTKRQIFAQLSIEKLKTNWVKAVLNVCLIQACQWYKNSDDKTLDVCQACYRKALRKRKTTRGYLMNSTYCKASFSVPAQSTSEPLVCQEQTLHSKP